jgi:hypothetical protein
VHNGRESMRDHDRCRGFIRRSERWNQPLRRGIRS